MNHNFRQLQLIQRNKDWLSADITWSEKIAFYVAILISYGRLVATGKKSVRYLGHSFQYDNVATPLNLQNYPYEITRKIQRNIAVPITSILDIGGNIGQFAVTAEHTLPVVRRIDVLEPNPLVYKILKSNTSYSPKIKAFNYAVGSPDDTFYYEDGRSAIGSFVKANAGNQANLRQVPVKTTSDIAALTKQHSYDLIVIDVEGYEYNLVKLLKNISAQYLYLEVSGSGRSKNYKHAQLLKEVSRAFGSFDIVYQSELSGNMNTLEYLFKFNSDETDEKA